MNIFKKAIETYGKDMQLTVAIEEFSELIKEICKSKRGSENRGSILEEMADCYIMLGQVRIIFCISQEEINLEVNQKLDRLAGRLFGRLYKVNAHDANASKAEFPKFEFKESENDDD